MQRELHREENIGKVVGENKGRDTEIRGEEEKREKLRERGQDLHALVGRERSGLSVKGTFALGCLLGPCAARVQSVYILPDDREGQHNPLILAVTTNKKKDHVYKMYVAYFKHSKPVASFK